ncbi:winged helix DNA-binding protein [Paracoccus sp. SMMA_5_TC]|nr:winged helix DNA-binding protein [Paracoccus sp. SMMA_5_TC]UXU81837.1 winged helix DNA-binding protein [Paracoccus sp. SMMA_5_TC]
MSDPDQSEKRNQPQALDRSWHLAASRSEQKVADLEYALMRCHEAFGRWQTECLAAVGDFNHSGPENALLHIIRMNDRPKTIHDLAHMANRNDIPNIQYSLRKLIAAGLVARSGSGRAGVIYQVTELGRSVTDRYARIRAELLVAGVDGVPGLMDRLADAARCLELLTGIYEQAARNAASLRRRPGHVAPGGDGGS